MNAPSTQAEQGPPGQTDATVCDVDTQRARVAFERFNTQVGELDAQVHQADPQCPDLRPKFRLCLETSLDGLPDPRLQVDSYDDQGGDEDERGRQQQP